MCGNTFKEVFGQWVETSMSRPLRYTTTKTRVQGKLARLLDDRYLSVEDATFVEKVQSDLEEFITFKHSNDRVLLFPPVNNYLRLLIHKTVEDYIGLHSFSVGEGSGRQTVVCWKEALISDSGASMSVYRPPVMRGRGRGRHRDSNSPGIRDSPQQKFTDVCKSSDRWSHDRFHELEYTEKDVGDKPSERNSPVNREMRENVSFSKSRSNADFSDTKSPPEISKPTDRPRSRNKRPDIQVYVPRARRSQDNKVNTSFVDDRNSQSLSNTSSLNKMSSVHSPAGSTTSEFVSPNQQVTSSNIDTFDQNTPVISATNTQSDRQRQMNKKLKTFDKRQEKEGENLPVDDTKTDLTFTQNSFKSDRNVVMKCDDKDNTKTGLPSTQNSFESGISVAVTCNDKDGANTNCDQVEDFRESRLGSETEHSGGSDKASISGSYEQSKESGDLSLSEQSQSCLTSNTVHNQKQTSDHQNSIEDVQDRTFTLDNITDESTTRVENKLSDNCGNKSAIVNEFDEKKSNESEHFQISFSSSNSVLDNENESGAMLKNTNETSNKESEVSEDHDSVNDDDENSLINSSYCKTETDFPVVCTGASASDVSDKLLDKIPDTENKTLNLSSELQDIDMCVDICADDGGMAIEETELAENIVQHQNVLSSVAQPESDSDSLETDASVLSSKNKTSSNTSVISKKGHVETHVISSETNHNEMMKTKDLTSHDNETKMESVADDAEGKVKQTDVFTDKREMSEASTSCKDSLVETESNIKAVPDNTDKNIVDKESVKDDGMEVEAEEDTWDSMFNEEGDCLDPSAMEELTKTVGKVKIQKSKKINYLDYQAKDKAELDYSEYGHIIEIYDFPAEFVTRDLITAFQPFLSRGFDLKWVDDTHALGIFGSAIAAQDAAGLIHPLIKVRPLSQASRQSRIKAKRCSEFLQPYKPRPETSATAARRLVAGALGIATNVSREKRERERQQLKEAKEKRRKDRQDREDIWEYGKCAMDEES